MSEVPGAKLTYAIVTHTLRGDVEGKGTVHFLMAYREDGSASFVGLQNVVGAIAGRSGPFVLQINGTFDSDTARSVWTVVPGSATGNLRGLRGEGGSIARHGEQQPSYTLDYDLEA